MKYGMKRGLANLYPYALDRTYILYAYTNQLDLPVLS